MESSKSAKNAVKKPSNERLCRVCRRQDTLESMIKIGEKSYAHPACTKAQSNIEDLDDFGKKIEDAKAHILANEDVSGIDPEIVEAAQRALAKASFLRQKVIWGDIERAAAIENGEYGWDDEALADDSEKFELSLSEMVKSFYKSSPHEGSLVPRRGRPLVDPIDKKDALWTFRTTSGKLAEYKEVASAEGLNLSQWVDKVLEAYVQDAGNRTGGDSISEEAVAEADLKEEKLN